MARWIAPAAPSIPTCFSSTIASAAAPLQAATAKCIAEFREEGRGSPSLYVESAKVFVLRVGSSTTTIAGRGRASSPAPEGQRQPSLPPFPSDSDQSNSRLIESVSSCLPDGSVGKFVTARSIVSRTFSAARPSIALAWTSSPTSATSPLTAALTPADAEGISVCTSSLLRGGDGCTTIAGRGRASSPTPEGPPFRFDRSQAGRGTRASRTAHARSLRSRVIGAGLPLSSGADHFQFPTFARALADRAGDHLGTAGAARTSATLSPGAMGRPVPQRVRPRATKTGAEQAPAVQLFGSIVPCTRHHTPASAMMQLSARHSCAGVA